MSNEDATHEAPTRREYVKYGGAVTVGGMLAGCTGQSSSESTPTETSTGDDSDDTSENGSWEVTMSPAGTVEFDSIPQSAAVYTAVNADILVALGQQDKINSLGFPDNFYSGYYDELSGVEFDTSDLTKLWGDGVDKEVIFELDSDIHHLDPARFTTIPAFGWDEADVEEISENVGPWLANYYSVANDYPGEGEYEFYSIWEMLDIFSDVYQVPARGEAMRTVRDEMLEDIYAELPPQEDRPDVGLIVYNPEEESFDPYRLNGEGYGKVHTRPLRANDALEEFEGARESNFEASAIDMEGMLEVDPDVLLHNFDWTNFRERTEAFFSLDEHPVGQELTAVQNDRIYATGNGFQGPIMNLFQVELTAKQIYPDLFGQAPEPEDTSGLGDLFDPQRVADIINGDI